MSRYVTIETDEGGLDYRTIADAMTVEGSPMGHSTVRNIIMRTMEKFASSLMIAYGEVGDPATVARSPAFQRMIAMHIAEIYEDRRRGGEIVRREAFEGRESR